MRGATHHGRRQEGPADDFNPRSSCEERPKTPCTYRLSAGYFNPRSSCEERLALNTLPASAKEFQSTLLMRGATSWARVSASSPANFNPRSSCEERPEIMISKYQNVVISIHAPHARSDVLVQVNPATFLLFQSTLLMRGATDTCQLCVLAGSISIHAPHARSDLIFRICLAA